MSTSPNYDQWKQALCDLTSRSAQILGKGEQATKQMLILPFLGRLGYDIWDPSEVCPEYEADFAIKKMGQKEKVDYAIVLAARPRMFIEVKPVGTSLDNHQGQLARYFNAVPDVTLGVLTNGLEYRFFSDTAETNIMDSAPFYVFKVDSPDSSLDVILSFQRSTFVPETVRDLALQLRHTAKLVEFLRDEIDLGERPMSDELLRWILSHSSVYDGRIAANALERFRPIAKSALQRVLRDIVRRSVVAMDDVVKSGTNPQEVLTPEADTVGGAGKSATTERSEEPIKITTTEDEIKCFEIVRSIFDRAGYGNRTMYDTVEKRDRPLEIGFRDTTGYFSIYLCRPSQWLFRVNLDAKQRYLVVNLTDALANKAAALGYRWMSPNAWGKYRLSMNGPEELNRIGPLLELAIESMLSAKAES